MSGVVVWFTGLSGAGKSTLADSFAAELRRQGRPVTIIDGDAIRQARKRPFGFSREDILQNGRDIIEACQQEVVHHDFVLVAVITPFAQTRQEARRALEPDYFEVYVATPLDVCAERDTKGLYKQAMAGDLPDLIGVSGSAPYERPCGSEFIVDTTNVSVEESRERVQAAIQEWLNTPDQPTGDLTRRLLDESPRNK